MVIVLLFLFFNLNNYLLFLDIYLNIVLLFYCFIVLKKFTSSTTKTESVISPQGSKILRGPKSAFDNRQVPKTMTNIQFEEFIKKNVSKRRIYTSHRIIHLK